ncbi:NADH:flavin oxidoreductase/NADH oxidase [Mycena rosella]|uniref:NADH:flavin oxidoreductase/NADH oxidase n=1 Tax=Mycena rosella TaxID=1033263 RepID=A0AAD7DE24_MYCRO|nr:NADH:flavin oxidoreductase/NADH oxidase [Mycena rosella]
MSPSPPSLFQATQLGDIQLKHRIQHVPLPHVQEYYAQRASVPGTLLITEATFIAPRAGGFDNVPGIWSEEQIAAWKQITDAVHAKGSFIYLQLWALGRAARPSDLKAEDPSFPYVSASDIPLRDRPGTEIRPRPLSLAEIREYPKLYATAASNAVHKAGFDGVEIHSANGYLLDQFLQDVSNVRTDQYGGSPENRSRFSLEVLDAVVAAVGPKKTGIRISPWNSFQDMGMKDPKPTFAYLVSQMLERHPDLAYIHLVEPRVDATTTRAVIPEGWSNDFLRDIWVSPGSARRFISAGGYTRALAFEFADTKDDLIAFGRQFISNPDLPYRVLHDIPFNEYDRKRFYAPGSSDPKGFTDYPFANDEIHRPLKSRF